MFVVIRGLKIEKGHLDKYIENFKKQSPVMASLGFVKKEIFIQTKHKEYDIVNTYIYFVDKEAYDVWHMSKEHKEGHKKMKEEGYVRPEEIILMTRESFTVITS